MVNDAGILKVQLIEPSDYLDKSIIFYERMLLNEKQRKISLELIDNVSDSGIVYWGRSFYGLDRWAGNGNKYQAGVIRNDVHIYVPDKIFYELFVNKNFFDYAPNKPFNTIFELDYDEYIMSKPIHRVNDYSVTYSISSRIVDGNIYYYSTPTIVDNFIPISNVKVNVKGYCLEEKGQEKFYENSFISPSQILRWSYGTFSDRYYAGGSNYITGGYDNISIDNGFMKCSDSTTGTFISDVIMTDTRNIERVKVTAIQHLINSGDAIEIFISADNGINYYPVTDFENPFDIPNVGKNLRIKVIITGTALLEYISIETERYILSSGLTSDNVEILVGNDSEGWTEVDNNVSTPLAVNELRYKVRSKKEGSTIYLRLVRLEYI